ncbi:di-trans,poly-cis-decaprenylcistransferase [Candidatus Kaiserbacteria bacterium]|nr:di-trans,poly-cis-decaprenylcistransferase [Candidatus Kaiserbacteria bacterium]
MPNIPNHVALIMDGNRRYGEITDGDKLKGHIKGLQAVEDIVRYAGEKQIKYITLYAFSTENWKRSEEEVTVLMNLFRDYFKLNLETLIEEGVRVRFIGRRDRLPSDIVSMMREVEDKSLKNDSVTLQIALDYGGRDEVVRAIKKIKTSNLSIESETDFGKLLDTANVPDPDLLIRTGGEKRLSGFLLWQLQYTELYFTDTLWPDFDSEEFQMALDWYKNRDRRKGK